MKRERNKEASTCRGPESSNLKRLGPPRAVSSCSWASSAPHATHAYRLRECLLPFVICTVLVELHAVRLCVLPTFNRTTWRTTGPPTCAGGSPLVDKGSQTISDSPGRSVQEHVETSKGPPDQSSLRVADAFVMVAGMSGSQTHLGPCLYGLPARGSGNRKGSVVHVVTAARRPSLAGSAPHWRRSLESLQLQPAKTAKRSVRASGRFNNQSQRTLPPTVSRTDSS